MTTDDDQMSILFDLWLVNHLLSGALDAPLTQATGLTGDEFGFYSLVRRFGPVSPGQICRWTALPATTVSAIVRRLAGRGHVELRTNPDDGRSRLVALTEAGLAAHAAAASVFFAETRPLAAALGAEEQRQRASLARLDLALRQVAGLDPRPYAIAESASDPDPMTTADGQWMSYAGPPLKGAEEDLARTFIAFLVSRRADGAS